MTKKLVREVGRQTIESVLQRLEVPVINATFQETDQFVVLLYRFEDC